MKQMKTLTLNETMYEIVDESGRNRISELEKESANLSTKIDEQINPLLETVNNEINSLKENYDTEIVNIISTHTEDIETLTTNIDTKITNPEAGTTGYVLSIKAVDESGKPTEYEAVANSGKTAYQYAQEGGYTGTEEEFLAKLAQENPTKVEFEELQSNVNTLENNLGGYSFYNNPEIIGLEMKEIYSPDGSEYILSESEEGMKLLEDTKKYESMLVIMLVADNTIYYNSEGISPIPNSEEGEVLLEDTETYYTAEVVILKTYEEYKTEDDKYILADSITGKELIATDMGSNKRYTTIVKEGNYYRIAGADSVIPFKEDVKNELLFTIPLIECPKGKESETELNFNVLEFKNLYINLITVGTGNLITITGINEGSSTKLFQEMPSYNAGFSKQNFDISNYDTIRIVIRTVETSTVGVEIKNCVFS